MKTLVVVASLVLFASTTQSMADENKATIKANIEQMPPERDYPQSDITLLKIGSSDLITMQNGKTTSVEPGEYSVQGFYHKDNDPNKAVINCPWDPFNATFEKGRSYVLSLKAPPPQQPNELPPPCTVTIN